MAYLLPEVFTQANNFVSHGPVRQSVRRHPEFKENMVFFETKVQNGMNLPKPLPYGVFAEIRNSNNNHESELQVWVSPGYYSGSVAFRERRSNLTKINKYICKAHGIQQVVAADSAAITGATVWESVVEDYDASHSISKVVYVDETNDVVRGVFDNNLGQVLKVTERLVNSLQAESAVDFPAKLTQLSGNLYEYVEYDEFKCGWYLRTTTKLNAGNSLTLWGTERHYWPSVLESGPIASPLFGEIKDEDDPRFGDVFDASILLDIRLKESYSGPCKASMLIGWSPTPPGAETPTQMVTDSFTNNGIFVKFTIPDCLHYPVTFNEFVGTDHPVLKDNQSKLFYAPQTTRTQWPTQVNLPQMPQPYLGGYLVKYLVIYPPV